MSPDVAASVKARLLALAKARGEEFDRTLTRFGAERLLYRLGESPVRERSLLKGARLLSVWLPDPYRATRDVDLLAFGASDDDAVRAMLEEICNVPCSEDGLRFDLTAMSVESIRPEEFVGKRARFQAYLGRARISVQIDIGFGDAIGAEPEEIDYPAMLTSLPAPHLRAYPREASVAEKFEAMVTLDTRNSRMKDFHDVWALSGLFRFEGPRLRAAIAACFERRATLWTAEAPRVLTEDFYRLPEMYGRWGHYLNAGAVVTRPPSEFRVIGERIRRFFTPVWEALIEGAPFMRAWGPGGPWEGSHTDDASR